MSNLTSPIPDLSDLDIAFLEAPLRELVHSLHRDSLRDRVSRLRFSRQAAARKGGRGKRQEEESE